MSLILMLSLQTAAVTSHAETAPASGRGWAMPALIARTGANDPLAFDLERFQARGGCSGSGAADILVCGPRRRGGDYPMARWARVFGPEPPIRAEMDLGHGMQGRIYSEAVPMDRGAVSNRVLIGIRTRF